MSGFDAHLVVMTSTKFFFHFFTCESRVNDSDRNLSTSVIQSAQTVPINQGTETGDGLSRFRCWDSSHASVPAHLRLRTIDGISTNLTTSFPGTSPPEFGAWRKFSTDANAVDGIQSNNEATLFRVRAFGDSGMGSNDVFVEARVYRRSSAGSEELLQEFEIGPITTSATNYDTTLDNKIKFNDGDFYTYWLRLRNDGVPV